ncbi:MAG: molybdopterin-guanine dinucleotide biosynthesis protein MobB, partial [Chloroflexota bacterium]|nr:molybdopterin-guanine dinucleotide biosynthesis protein MobB [Chloroflexota bacterium]
MDTTMQLEAGRLDRAKFAYTTGRVHRGAPATLLGGERLPRSGDLVLARVVQVGQHKKLERPDGRQSTLFPGDEIVVCYGHRYAPDQFEAEIPADLAPCHLVAGGGVASWVLSQHAGMGAPTVIEPVGLLGDREGRPLNLADFALPPVRPIVPRPPTVAVVGTSMNAGKTAAAAHLIRGLARAGLRVGAAKVTGTGAGKDAWLMRDAGADPVLDFTAAGFPSTYRATPAQVEGALDLLTDHLTAAGADAIVLEVADGIYQGETAALVPSPRFAARVDGVL